MPAEQHWLDPPLAPACRRTRAGHAMASGALSLAMLLGCAGCADADPDRAARREANAGAGARRGDLDPGAPVDTSYGRVAAARPNVEPVQSTRHSLERSRTERQRRVVVRRLGHAHERPAHGHASRVAGEVPVRGDLVPDAHLVAILRQHGVRTLCTRDRDFRK